MNNPAAILLAEVQWPHWLWLLVVFPLAAYVIGSTPCGFLIAKFRGVDIRKAGSGNVGATNVARVVGRGWGYLCFVCDVAKGFVPAAAVTWLTTCAQVRPGVYEQLSWLLVATAAICGHVFSFWLKFRGGKGVATALGAVLGIFPYFTYAGLAALGVWLVVTLISRYVSVGSIVAAVAFVPLMVAFNWLGGREPGQIWLLLLFSAVMVAMIVLRHGGNIRRLLGGTESKIGCKDESTPAGSSVNETSPDAKQ